MKTNSVLNWFVINAKTNRIVEDNIPSRRIARIIKNLLKMSHNDDFRIGKLVVAK